ncbi:hypothetical protein [Flavobacterium sp.]|jgi:hypothetical protein|uniref:hypothetical protein n=1 Tax=Flavobacterium sp. TaxID=239 RepID=UPI0025D6A677|nr:hypothetical protein [Flavobacterium sp.]
MISKETKTFISIVKNGIVLNPKSKNKEQIPFTDVAKIHISIQQRQFALKSFLIGYFIFTLFCLQYLNVELSILSVLIFSINFVVMNTLDFKTYRLQIILKNNTIIEKRIPKKLKYEFITLINEVRNELKLKRETIL